VLYIVLLLVLTALGLVVAALVTASSLWAWVSIVASGLAGALLVVDWARRRLRNSTRKTFEEPESSGESESGSDGERDGDRADGIARDGTDGAETAESEQTTRTVSDVSAVAGTEPAEAVTAEATMADEGSVSAGDAVSAKSATTSETSGRARFESARTVYAGALTASTREPVVREGVDSLTDTAPRTALLASSGELAGADVDPPEEETSPEDALLVAKLEVEVLVVDEYPRYHLADCSWLGSRATIPLAVKEARDLGFTPCGLCGPDALLAANHRKRRLSRRNTM
jgi:hypothetical protein